MQIRLMTSHIKARAFNGPYLNLQGTFHYTFHSTIKNFSACCNTSRAIKMAASQA